MKNELEDDPDTLGQVPLNPDANNPPKSISGGARGSWIEKRVEIFGICLFESA
jgi:hypothetical protein